jgi:hypothetical protein
MKNFIFKTPEARIDELLFQEPITKVPDPNSKYNGSILIVCFKRICKFLVIWIISSNLFKTMLIRSKMLAF